MRGKIGWKQEHKVLTSTTEPRKRSLPTKWVLVKKPKLDGTVQFKAKLVVCGNHQEEEEVDSFTPVVALETVRLLLALTNTRGLHVYQMEVDTAYLNGEMDEEVFIMQPQRSKSSNNQQCYKLLKALYGLPQSERKCDE